MFDRLKSTVFILLRTLLRTKISSPWDPDVIPKCPEPILSYSQRLAAMGITQLKNYQVTSVKAYKSKETCGREYISVAVFDLHKNKASNVIIERLSGGLGPNPSSDSISSISLPSNSITSTCSVEDIIAPISSGGSLWKKSDELICELNFEKELYLYELAVLAVVVHEVDEDYRLMANNQCHYIGTIMKVLQEEYKALNAVGGADAEGKWCGVVIYSGQESISSVHEKFKSDVKEFVSSVPMLSILPLLMHLGV